MKSLLLFLVFIALCGARTYNISSFADGSAYGLPTYQSSLGCYSCTFYTGYATAGLYSPPFLGAPTTDAYSMFNLSSISTCSVISATLTVYLTSSSSGNMITIDRVSTGWSEALLCPAINPISGHSYTCPGNAVNVNELGSYSSCTTVSGGGCTSAVTPQITAALSFGLVAFSLVPTYAGYSWNMNTHHALTNQPLLTIVCA
jgi:hypothetical protein